MKTISQRELRNDNAEIIRGIEAGTTYTVTRRGVPVARLTPFSEDSDLRCARAARTRPRFSSLPRVTLESSSATILDDLRGDR